MWRDARVSRCAYSGKPPGNYGANPPSFSSLSRLDGLLGGGRRPERTGLVPSMRLRTVLTFYNRTWPDLAGLGRTWEGGSLQLEHLLESEEDNEIEILPNGEIRAVGGEATRRNGVSRSRSRCAKTSAGSTGRGALLSFGGGGVRPLRRVVGGGGVRPLRRSRDGRRGTCCNR